MTPQSPFTLPHFQDPPFNVKENHHPSSFQGQHHCRNILTSQCDLRPIIIFFNLIIHKPLLYQPYQAIAAYHHHQPSISINPLPLFHQCSVPSNPFTATRDTKILYHQSPQPLIFLWLPFNSIPSFRQRTQHPSTISAHLHESCLPIYLFANMVPPKSL